MNQENFNIPKQTIDYTISDLCDQVDCWKSEAKYWKAKYDQFVPWVEEYLNACETYPDAHVEVSR